jgi:hypothetical protein
MGISDFDLEEMRRRMAANMGQPIPEQPTAPDTRSEAQIEADCTKLLEEDGWRALRTDPVSDRGRGKGFGEIGMADHLYIRYGPRPYQIWKGQQKVNDDPWMDVTRCQAEIMWIEFKRPGEKAQKHQRAWHTAERARGALTLIAGEDFPATVEGFREFYAKSGLMRRKRWW